VLIFAAFFVCGLAAAEAVRCEATRDAWLSSYKGETDYNMGAAPQMKLKSWQEFGLIDFDVSKLKGKVIGEVYLYVKPMGETMLKLPSGSDLQWLSLSTVSHDWVEGKSTKYAKDTDGFGATFNESSHSKCDWGFSGAKCWDVILGNGNTLRCDGRLEPSKGWLRMKVDSRLIQALVAKAGYGLCIMDGSTMWYCENYICTRESKNGPYLEVAVSGGDAAPPAAPSDVTLAPAPNLAGQTLGAVVVSLKVPREAFAYRVKINGSDVARWQVPFAGKEGETQSFPILDLEPDAEVKLEIAAVDASGNESPFASASGKASPKLTVPTLPVYGFEPKPGDPKPLGNAKVWAFPEVTKVDPVSGNVLQEKGAEDFRKANPVWDGASGIVRLAAARGEIVSFQIAIEGEAKGCRIEVSSLQGPGEISNRNVNFWRNWYVGNQAEYAVPLKDAFDCPMSDNKIEGQKLQAVTVDYHIPADSKPGDYQGMVKVSAGEARTELGLKVKVYDVVIPDEIHFNPELNCYSGPGKAGSDKFKESHRLAHYHRCTINRVPYGQTGYTHDDWIPKIDDKGHVTDWSNFDNNLGGLLDGSWFKDNPRPGIPVPTFYLPVYEGWPADFRKHYRPGDGVPLELTQMKDGKREDDKIAKLKHDALALPIDEAIDQEFGDAFVNCTSDFAKHFKEKGWNKTIAECYLNNKYGYGYTMWTLDEPYQYLDWAALNFFGKLWKKAIDDPAVYTLAWQEDLFRRGLAAMNRDRATFLFRGDISRPAWQGNCSDGIINILYLGGGSFFEVARLEGNTKRRAPAVLYCYGSCNPVERSNWESAAWCLKAYAIGADGVLPWQSLGKASAMTKADQCSLLIDAEGYGSAVASFRVHALRRGAQDCELLRLLQLKHSWSRGHLAVLVSQKVPLSATAEQTFLDDAAAVKFGALTSSGFCELKEGILKLLTAP
jgi:hypothetical protein